MKKYAIGVDYGTLSVRALLVDIETGEEAATSVYPYPHGVMEKEIPTGVALPANWALQYPGDYYEGLITTIKDVLQQKEVAPAQVVSIGVDFTAATILPVTKEGIPLCELEEWKKEPHTYVKVWKHHGGEKEAQDIDRIMKERGDHVLDFYGGKVSSEWMLPKILETLRYAPEVYNKADRFIESLDWVVWKLTGIETRSTCAAGYKIFYREGKGYPSHEFFRGIDPKLEYLVEEKLEAPLRTIGQRAGYLSEEMADILGLTTDVVVGAGIVDAHSAVLGSGISKPGQMLITVGTSSCHLLLSEKEVGVKGIGGIVKDGIVPGIYGCEAGQSCVGDGFAWFVNECVPESYYKEAEEKGMGIYALLEEKLQDYKVGSSGLLALDWLNGVRTPLADFQLNGMILGLHLGTKPEEIYMALIEATAYGTRWIMEQFEEAGLPVEGIVLGGGIPMKNKTLVQVYADICKREVRIAGTSQASAMGAAIAGAAAADPKVTGCSNIQELIQKLGKTKEECYLPRTEEAAIYDKLYTEYKTLCQYFGQGGNDVMKRLHKIREEQTNL